MAIVIDMVCGKEVDKDKVNAVVGTAPGGGSESDPKAGTKRFYEGKWYYFCSLECRQKFIADPKAYLEKK